MLVEFTTKYPGYLVNKLDDRIEYIYKKRSLNGAVVLTLLLDPKTPIEEIDAFAEEFSISSLCDRKPHKPKILSNEQRAKAVEDIKKIKKLEQLQTEADAERLGRAIQPLVEGAEYKELVRQRAEAGVFGNFHKLKYGSLSNRIKKEICKEVWKSFK